MRGKQTAYSRHQSRPGQPRSGLIISSPPYHPATTAKGHQQPPDSPTACLSRNRPPPLHPRTHTILYSRACACVNCPRSKKRYTRVHQRANHHAKPGQSKVLLIGLSATQASIQQVKREDTRREGRKCSASRRVQVCRKTLFEMFHGFYPPKSEFRKLK